MRPIAHDGVLQRFLDHPRQKLCVPRRVRLALRARGVLPPHSLPYGRTLGEGGGGRSNGLLGCGLGRSSGLSWTPLTLNPVEGVEGDRIVLVLLDEGLQADDEPVLAQGARVDVEKGLRDALRCKGLDGPLRYSSYNSLSLVELC